TLFMAAFFIDARAKRSVAKSCIFFFYFQSLGFKKTLGKKMTMKRLKWVDAKRTSELKSHAFDDVSTVHKG
uniref:hypothetical protein n=1 Tax=Cronobacter dublinensis TaxID=413497 RepID=UPI001F474BDE